MRLSGDGSNNELGSPSVNLEEGGSRTQAVEAGEGNVLGSIPELETLFHRCELCFRAFRKKVGLSLHMKAKHAVEYNATINTQRVKPRWEREESYLLAKAEVELGKVPNINLKLHERFPERSFDSIKSHRRQGFYRDMVAEIRAGRGSSFSVRPLEPDCTQEAGSCALSDTTDTSLVVALLEMAGLFQLKCIAKTYEHECAIGANEKIQCFAHWCNWKRCREAAARGKAQE